MSRLLEEYGAAFEEFKKKHTGEQQRLQRQIDELAKKQLSPGATFGEKGGHGGDEFLAELGHLVKTGQAPEHSKALTIGDVDTGRAVPIQLAPVLNTVLAKRNVFRKLCKVQPTESEKYEELVGQGDQTQAWVAETDARPATTPVGFKKISPVMGEQYVNVPVSQQLIEDAEYDVGKFVVEEAGRQFAAAESLAIVSGDGTAKPKGFLTHTLAAAPTWGQIKQVKSGVAGQLTYDTLVDLVYNGVPAEYREGASFVAGPTTIAAIRNDEGRPR